MIATAIAVGSLAVGAAGLGLSAYGASQNAKSQKAAAQKQYMISQQQIAAAGVQQQNAAALATAQMNIADVQREQNQLGITTQKDVISQQMLLEQNRLLQQKNIDSSNVYKRDATVNQEQIAERNDTLNRGSEDIQRNIFDIERVKDEYSRYKDIQDTELETLQGRVTALAATRQQREIVRQGIAARSSAMVQAVHGGQQAAGNTGRQAQAATLTSKTNMGVQTSIEDRMLAEARQNVAHTERTYGIAQRELGVQQREGQAQQFELGTQARGLGIESRMQNYGVALNQFDTTAKNADLTNQQFDVNKNISNIYLAAQDANSQLVQRAYAANANLIGTNLSGTNQLLNIQKNVYQLGGDVSVLNQNAASAAGLGSVGGSLIQGSGLISKNMESFDRVFSNMGGSKDFTSQTNEAMAQSAEMGVTGVGGIQ